MLKRIRRLGMLALLVATVRGVIVLVRKIEKPARIEHAVSSVLPRVLDSYFSKVGSVAREAMLTRIRDMLTFIEKKHAGPAADEGAHEAEKLAA